MTDNIKTWGCFQRSQNRKFATNKEQKPIVRISTEMECRYDQVVREEEEINPEEITIIEEKKDFKFLTNN